MVSKAFEVSDVVSTEYDNFGFDDSLSPYQREWESLFSSKKYLERLKSLAIKGKLKTFHFRSICWKIFLQCLPEDQNAWVETAKSQRQQYIQILDKYNSNPRDASCMDLSVNNPLSQAHQNPWIQYFQDEELKVTIQQDVVRTFPEIEFFHLPEIQKMMASILFSYAREFPHMSYKQGMHELLAPIIFVLHYDQQAYLQASETDNLNLDIHILLNQNYIEHDAFFIFCHLMEAVESWYTVNDSPYSKYTLTPEPFSQRSVTFNGNSLSRKLKKIYELLLNHHDKQLFSHLEQMEITPQIFGIRWLRLLFGREFSMNDLLILWDAIFSDSITFELVDYIFVAMLISVRELILSGDYASCLSHLMRFPNVVDVHYIVDLALHLRNPKACRKPEGNSMKILNPLHLNAFRDVKSNVYKGSTKSLYPGTAKPVHKIHSNINKFPENRPKSLSIAKLFSNNIDGSSSGARPKSSSLNERDSSPDSIDSNHLEDSSFVYVDRIASINENKVSSFTLPRTKIQNVMEGRNEFSASDLFSPGNVSDEKLPSKTVDKEMIPLALPSLSTHNSSFPDQSVKNFKTSSKCASEEVKKLRSELSELKSMNKYCTQQITQHVEKLQETLMQQQLQYEDQMFIALAGLKRARDILKGTVNFTKEIIGDDMNPYCAVSCNSIIHSNNTSPDSKIKLKCVENDTNTKCSKNDKIRGASNQCTLNEAVRNTVDESDQSLCYDFSDSLLEVNNISNQEHIDKILLPPERNLPLHS